MYRLKRKLCASVGYRRTRNGNHFKRPDKIILCQETPGNPQLHRLRVIHLYESDYNSLLGIKMRQVIHKAEDRLSIHNGTYGSRASRQASDPTYLEVLQYDYASLTRWPEIQFSNDATPCYDRIVPSVSNVIARSMGLHRNIAQIHGDMSENAVYRIKTQLGLSKGSYQHSNETPVFGTGKVVVRPLRSGYSIAAFISIFTKANAMELSMLIWTAPSKRKWA